MQGIPGPHHLLLEDFPTLSAIARNGGDFPRLHSSSVLRLCVVSDWNYLPFFVGLWKNLEWVHGKELHVDFLSLDDKTAEYVRRNYDEDRLACHRLTDLWDPEERAILEKRRTADIAYASKSRLLKLALRTHGQPVLYSDLDIFYFRSPLHLFTALGGGSAMLFPQWGDAIRLVRDYGMFNAGMVAVAPSSEPFLDWWASLCLHEYETDIRRGYFVDQGFLDLAPLYFPEIRIYREKDENVAGWNLSSLGIRKGADSDLSYLLRDGRPLGSFHAVGPDWLGLFRLKAAWDQLSWLYSPLGKEPPSPALVAQTLSQQKGNSLELSRLDFLMSRLRLLGFDPNWRTPRVLDFFCRGLGRHLLALLARLHYPTRSVQHAMTTAAEKWQLRGRAHYSFWIELQRRFLRS